MVEEYQDKLQQSGDEVETVYGSIPNEIQVETESTSAFEEYDTNYVQPRSLTYREKTHRCIRATTPVVVSLILVVAIGVLFFDEIIPCGPNGAMCTDRSHKNNVIRSRSPPTPDSRSCEQNKGCHFLGLEGNCCPTDEGFRLGCCPLAKDENPNPPDDATKTKTKTKQTSEEDIAITPGTQTTDAEDSGPHSSAGQSAKCSQNPDCKDIGLIGACCPTDAGALLGCCKSQNKMSVSSRGNTTNQESSLKMRTEPTGGNSSEVDNTNSTATDSSCGNYPACKTLGLTGECCPTPEGIQLGCCL